MFGLTMSGGQCLGLPDVCKTPTPGGPVPVPYPNMSTAAAADPSTADTKTIVVGTPALNLSSKIMLSNGDEAGSAMGVVSGMIMGPTAFIAGSAKVIIGGAPAVRLTSATAHNGSNANCPGVCLAPSQVKMMILG
ncbi:MAG: DUF4150 domain-containing protein [Proteobacteria bacterium]|nr:DUF4150 domain-containing protein [Pseudomonadota bacterium]